MSRLLELTRKLQETETAIVRAERDLAKNRESAILRWSLESVVRRRNELENDYSELAYQNSIDVLRYRIFSETDERVSVRGMSKSLQEFQTVLSAIYNAVEHGPKHTLKFSADVHKATRLEFGYAFAGSFGVVLTIASQTTLFDNEKLASSAKTFLRLVQSRTMEELREAGKELGPAPIRALSKWTRVHVKNRIGADISWSHEDSINRLLVSYSQMRRLQSQLQAAPDKAEEEEVELRGTFFGVNLKSGTFKFLADNGDEISGDLSDAIGVGEGMQVGKIRYQARLKRVNTSGYLSAEEKVSWHLLELTAVSD